MATKNNYSVLYGSASGRYNLNTSVSVSGSIINWSASVRYVDGVGADKLRVRVYDSDDSSVTYNTPWISVDETSGANGSFSGSWTATKTFGTVSFFIDFYRTDEYNFENRETVVMTDNYAGATIYEPPSCSISIQTGASFSPGGQVSLRLRSSGSVVTGVLRRFYKAPSDPFFGSQNVRSGLISSTASVSDTIPSSYVGGQVYWDYTVSDGTTTVSAQTAVQTIVTNSAPTAPEILTVPNSIAAGQIFAISWTASTDPDGNLAGYILERSIDGGNTWASVYQGAALTTNDVINAGTTRVRYRVYAYDTYGVFSGYTLAPSSGDITVSNNHAPTTPASPITITPSSLTVGTQAVISWGESTDEDGDSFNYVLERSVNNLTSYTPVYTGTSRTYTDEVGSWTSVSYRVKAVDVHNAASGYRTAETKTIASNAVPTLSVKYSGNEVTPGADVGTFSDVFNLVYQVNDINTSDTLVVKEIVDGTVRKTVSGAVRGQDYTFAFTNGSNVSYWKTILNGSHSVTISVTDGKVTVSKTVTFLKSVGACTITLASAITASANIEKVAVSICGSIPAGGLTAVQVTADNGTHWEDCVLASGGTGVTEYGLGGRKKKKTGALAEELLGGHYLFIHTMTNTGTKFNFRVQAEKVGDVGGFISSVQGTFIEAAAT